MDGESQQVPGVGGMDGEKLGGTGGREDGCREPRRYRGQEDGWREPQRYRGSGDGWREPAGIGGRGMETPMAASAGPIPPRSFHPADHEAEDRQESLRQRFSGPRQEQVRVGAAPPHPPAPAGPAAAFKALSPRRGVLDGLLESYPWRAPLALDFKAFGADSQGK